MTAYELAEKLTDALGSKERWEIRSAASNMLKRQADEIEHLNKVLTTYAHKIIDQQKKINDLN